MIITITKQAKQTMPAAFAMSVPSCALNVPTVDAFAGLVARGRHAGAGQAVRRSGSL